MGIHVGAYIDGDTRRRLRAAGLKILRERLALAEARQVALDAAFHESLLRRLNEREVGRLVSAKKVLRDLRAQSRKPLVERSATRRFWVGVARERLSYDGPLTDAGRLLGELQQAFCGQACRPRKRSLHRVHPLATLDIWADVISNRSYGNAAASAASHFAHAFHTAACWRVSERPLPGGLSRLVSGNQALYYAQPEGETGGIVVLAWTNLYAKKSEWVNGPLGADGELVALEWLDLAARKEPGWIRTALEALGTGVLGEGPFAEGGLARPAPTEAWNRAVDSGGQPGDESAAKAFRRRTKVVVRLQKKR